MISFAAFTDELQKIAFAESAYSSGTDFRTPVKPSRLAPGFIPHADRGGSPVPGQGFEPTRGGFMLASGVQKTGEKEEEKRDKEKDSESMSEGYYPYSPGDFKKAKLAFSPANQLASTSRALTKPNSLGSKGMSIQQTAKPFGFGRAGAVAGTDKGGKI